MLFLGKSSNCDGLSQEKDNNNGAILQKVGKKIALLPHADSSRTTSSGDSVRKECRKKARLPQKDVTPSAKRRHTFRGRFVYLPQDAGI